MLLMMMTMNMTHVKIHDLRKYLWGHRRDRNMNRGTLLQKKNLSSVWSRIQTYIQSDTESKHFGNKDANIKMAMIFT